MQFSIMSFGGELGTPVVVKTDSAREALTRAEVMAATYRCDLEISTDQGPIDILDLGRLAQQEFTAETAEASKPRYDLTSTAR